MDDLSDDLSEGCSTRTYTWEKLNYFRVCYVAYQLIPVQLRQLFKREWDFLYSTSLGEWQDTPKNLSDFCNQERVKNAFHATISSGNTAEWDCTCLFMALLDSRCVGSLLSPVVRQNVYELRHIRDEIVHSSKTTFTDKELQSYIGEISAVFTSLGLSCNDVQAALYATCTPTATILKQKDPSDKPEPIKCKGEPKRDGFQHQVGCFCALSPLPPHKIIRRSHDIERIAQKMQMLEEQNNGAVSYIYLSGPPGTGKSQLSRQLGEHFYEARLEKNEQTFVATLEAQTLEALADSYFVLAHRLRISEFILLYSDLDKGNLVNTIKHLVNVIMPKLRQFSSWLLIVDNAADVTLEGSFLPDIGSKEWGHGQVIVTARNSHAIPLDSSYIYHESLSKGMELSDAIALLEQMSKLPHQKQVEKVAEILDFQPISLVAAAEYVRLSNSNDGWEEYLRRIHFNELERNLAAVNIAYPVQLKKEMEMMVTGAVQSDEIVRHVLCLLSFCGPEPLPVTCVVNYVRECTLNQTEETIKVHIRRCPLFIFPNQGSRTLEYLKVSKVLHEVIRNTSFFTVESTEKSRFIATAIEVFSSLIQEQLESSLPQFCFVANVQKLTVHCQTLLEHAISLAPVENLLGVLNAFIGSDEIFSWLCHTAVAFDKLDSPLLAKKFSTFACELILHQSNTEIGSKKGQMRAAYVFTLNGKVLEQLCEFTESCESHKKALLFRQALYGEEHSDVATSYHNLGTVYSKLGLYNQAEQFHEKALNIRIGLFGRENGDVAASYQSLGNVFSHIGRFRQAKEYHSKALNIKRKIYGEEHGEVAAPYRSLGIVCSDLGEYNEAKEYYEKALLIKTNIYGEEHGDVAAGYHSLGIVHSNLRQYIQAREFHQKALCIRQKIFGEEHVDAAASFNSLGVVSCNLGDYSAALEFYQKALDIRRKKLGCCHVDVAAIYSNLGILYSNIGDNYKAKEAFENALLVRKEIFGEVNRDVASSYESLGVVYRNLGQYRHAVDSCRKALSIRVEVLGDQHPDVASAYNNLGDIHGNLGEYDEAKNAYEKSLHIRLHTLGDLHGHVAQTYNSLGAINNKLEQYSQASEFYMKALHIAQTVFGKEHGTVAKIYGNLGGVYKNIKEYATAKAYYNRALVILEKNSTKDHKTIAKIYDELAAIDDLMAVRR